MFLERGIFFRTSCNCTDCCTKSPKKSLSSIFFECRSNSACTVFCTWRRKRNNGMQEQQFVKHAKSHIEIIKTFIIKLTHYGRVSTWQTQEQSIFAIFGLDFASHQCQAFMADVATHIQSRILSMQSTTDDAISILLLWGNPAIWIALIATYIICTQGAYYTRGMRAIHQYMKVEQLLSSECRPAVCLMWFQLNSHPSQLGMMRNTNIMMALNCPRITAVNSISSDAILPSSTKLNNWPQAPWWLSFEDCSKSELWNQVITPQEYFTIWKHWRIMFWNKNQNQNACINPYYIIHIK